MVRHRAAAEPAAKLNDLVATGWLRVRAARLVELRPSAVGFEAAIRARGSAWIDRNEFGTVINCTGPSGDVRTTRDPLMAYLRDRGMISPDPLGLGIAVAPDGAVVDRAGRKSELLYYIGPMARAGYWERTAVPELRVAALGLAETIAASLPGSATAKWAA